MSGRRPRFIGADRAARLTGADRAARGRVVRRRRLVALAAAGMVVILAVAMILNHRSGDAFAGT